MINEISKVITQRIYSKSVVDKRDIALIVRKTLKEYESILYRVAKNGHNLDR